MMTWAAPLWFLLLPAILLLWWWMRRLTSATSSATPHLYTWPPTLATASRPFPFPWMLLAALCLPLALARPQWGRSETTAYQTSREVLLALDLSRSMSVADIPPSRLARARLLVENLLDQLRGERVGLLLFAGTSFLQCPLSSDYEILREFLPELTPDYLPQGGTEFRAMLDTAAKAFSDDAGSDRFLIILSDGEDLGGDWESAIPDLKQQRIRVIALGIGTAEGGIVLGPSGGVVKDERGAAVLSRMNPDALQRLTSATDGIYGDGSVWVDLPSLINNTIAKGRAVGFQERQWNDQTERFQWPLLAACLFASLSLLLEFPGHPRRPKRPFTPFPAARILILALFCLPGTLCGQNPPAPPADPAQKVADTVRALSAMPSRPPEGYAQLAQATIAYAESPEHGQDPHRIALIDDALDAVKEGARLAPQSTPWPEMERQLNALRNTPPPPPKNSPPKDSPDKKDAPPDDKPGEKPSPPPSPKDKDNDTKPSADGNKNPQDQAPPPGPTPPKGQDNTKSPPPPPSSGEADTRPDQPEKNDPLSALEKEGTPQEDKIRAALKRDSPGRLFQKMDAKGNKRPSPDIKKDW